MGSLIRRISALSSAAYGVNIYSVPQPKVVRGARTDVVGMVADLPWGPVLTRTTCGTPAEFLKTFYPKELAPTRDSATWPAIRAILNKTWPAGGLEVVRIDRSSVANVKATYTFDDDDGSPQDSVTVTARYEGALGNNIKIAWTANADDATARDATVTIVINGATTYSVTYASVATMVSGSPVVTDPGDPFVVFALAGSANEVPAVVSATALETGANGTAQASDYTGSDKGIELFYSAGSAAQVLFVAEPPDAMVDAINAKLLTFATTANKLTVLCTPLGETATEAATDAASYRDKRCIYPWPQVETTDFFMGTPATVTVQGNAWIAFALANTDPWKSWGGAPGAQFLRGITGLENEDASDSTYETLNDAGVQPFFVSTELGTIVRRAVTTSITSGETNAVSRRMADYIENSIAGLLVQYAEDDLDLDLANQRLGPVTGPEIGAIDAFLEGLKKASRIRSYAVDPYGENTQGDIDAGQWTIGIQVKLLSQQAILILASQMGEAVEIQEQ